MLLIEAGYKLDLESPNVLSQSLNSHYNDSCCRLNNLEPNSTVMKNFPWSFWKRKMGKIASPLYSTSSCVQVITGSAGFKCTVNLCTFEIPFLGHQFWRVKWKTEVTLSTLKGQNSHGISLILTLPEIISFIPLFMLLFVFEILHQFLDSLHVN